MKNIKFIKEPGYLYDLFFLFILHFNREYCLTNMINYNQSAEDTDYFNRILLDFEAIPNELLPFFYLKENGKSFMADVYYEPYKEEFTTTYNLSTVQAALTNHEDVISRLIKFYFTDVNDQTLAECKSSIASIGRLIKESNYSDTVKSSLYAFFIDPVPVIQKLSYELMAKEFQLAQQYEKGFRKLIELQHQFDVEAVSEKLKLCKNESCRLEGFDDIYVTFCLIHKNCIKECFLNNKVIVILGSDYLNHFEYIVSQNRLPELDTFGNALAEKNRLEILDLIWRKEEITIKDIEQELGFTGTNAYYHLSLMIKASMLRTRNQGRTVLYSINKRYFDVVRDMLSKYSS